MNDKLIEELKKAVAEKDNEMAHVAYDDILIEIAKKHEPELLKQMDEIVGDLNFWWA